MYRKCRIGAAPTLYSMARVIFRPIVLIQMLLLAILGFFCQFNHLRAARLMVRTIDLTLDLILFFRVRADGHPSPWSTGNRGYVFAGLQRHIHHFHWSGDSPNLVISESRHIRRGTNLVISEYQIVRISSYLDPAHKNVHICTSMIRVGHQWSELGIKGHFYTFLYKNIHQWPCKVSFTCPDGPTPRIRISVIWQLFVSLEKKYHFLFFYTQVDTYPHVGKNNGLERICVRLKGIHTSCSLASIQHTNVYCRHQSGPQTCMSTYYIYIAYIVCDYCWPRN